MPPSKKVLHCLSLVIAVSVSACGTVEATSDTHGTSAKNPTYGEITAFDYTLRRESQLISFEQGASQNIPIKGVANYTGTAFFREASSPNIVSTANLITNFENSGFSGELSSFIDQNGTTYDGRLEIAQGKIDRSNGSFEAKIFGQLTSEDPSIETADVSGTFSGTIYGQNNTYFRGPTSSTWETNVGQQTEERRSFHGEITVKKEY